MAKSRQIALISPMDGSFALSTFVNPKVAHHDVGTRWQASLAEGEMDQFKIFGMSRAEQWSAVARDFLTPLTNYLNGD